MKIDRDTLREIAETIGSNKRRSIATAFGVFWGMFMLIILLSLSNGIRNGIDEATKNLAPNMIFMVPENTSVAYQGLPKQRVWHLRERDLEITQAHIPEIALIAGSMTQWLDDKTIVHQGRTSGGALMGITQNYFQAYKVSLLKGRLLNNDDYKEARKCCLLGIDQANRLFDVQEDPIGQRILVKGTSFVVVGLVKELSDMIHIGGDLDESILVPIPVVQNIKGRPGQISIAAVAFRSIEGRDKALEKMKTILKDLNSIAPTDDRAINIFDIDELLGFFRGVNEKLDLLVWLVGMGTLITGIVGISNILLVTVKERTSEIGIRRALGAKPRDIILQLILESLSLTLLAGLLGIMLGVGIMSLIAPAFSELGSFPFVNPTVEMSTVLVALSVLIISGLLAGLIPAMKAIEVKAIEAIREE